MEIYKSMFYSKSRSHFIRRFLVTYVVIVAFLLIFLGGTFLGYKSGQTVQPKLGGEVLNQTELPPYLLQNVDFGLFWDVWKIVKDKYLEQPVADTRLFYGSLAGLVASLGDPYSNFLEPEITKKFTSELAGTFEGIGAEIGIKKEQLQIVAPLPNTPAEKAGLKAKDRILAIDGKDTVGMAIDFAVSIIRGTKGTNVVLKIFREGWDEPKDITITRDEIHIESVSWRMINDTAYIKIVLFNGDTFPKFESVVQEALLKNPKGFILDLRNNPGGYFDAAVQIASFWVPSPGLIVSQRGKGNKKGEFLSDGPAPLKEFPTVVLVNGGSASASEIVAGALQDQGKAKIVGEKTFGKGSVQDYEALQGGSSIKITVAEWLTPKGRSINKEGIAPDVEVKFTKSDYEIDKDPQLDEAVKILKK